MRLLRNVKWWHWLLAAGVVVGLVAGGYLSNKFANAVYTSTSQVLMTGQGDPAQPDPFQRRQVSHARSDIPPHVCHPFSPHLDCPLATPRRPSLP